jgi:hypothetical protein
MFVTLIEMTTAIASHVKQWNGRREKAVLKIKLRNH